MTSEDLITQEKTNKTRYYITSLTDLDPAIDAIRAHWDSGNELRLRLDCSFLEDADTTVDHKALQGLRIMSKMCSSLYKLAKPLIDKKASIRTVRKIYGWDLEHQLSTLLNAFDEDAIHEALRTATQKKTGTRKSK